MEAVSVVTAIRL